MTHATRRGLILLVSAPSGCGKTTLCDRLRQEFPRLSYSVSYTTRTMRGEEVDGVHYNFVSEEEFSRRKGRGELAEWATVHGNSYGTSIAAIDASLEADQDVLMDVDWQGAAQLKRRYPDDLEQVFILPPGVEELSRRLRARGTDSDEVIRRRLAAACEEIRHSSDYDHLVVNDDLDCAYDDLRSVYRAAHMVQRRRTALLERILVQGAAKV